MGTVTNNTNVTASPKPKDVFTFLETAKKEHIPKKKAKIMLSTKIDLKNKLIRCSIMLFLLYQNKNDEPK